MATERAARSGSSAAPLSSARRRRRRIALAAAAVLLLAAVLGAVWFQSRPLKNLVMREKCTATLSGSSYDLTPEQARYAALITGVSAKRGLPVRAGTVAVATAMQESKLANLSYGDQAGPDSRGLFQQRPSQGWGTEAQIQDPLYATNAFYDGLAKVSGWQSMTITQAAQAVQRSAYPEAYAQHESAARAFVAALRGQSSSALTCTLRGTSTAGVPHTVIAQLSSETGAKGTARGTSVWVPGASAESAWGTAQWAVAEAEELGIESVSVEGRRWSRSSGAWEEAAAPEGAEAHTVVISLSS